MENPSKPFNYLNFARNLLLYGSLFTPVLLFLPIPQKEYGQWAWSILLVILAIRPLANLLPKSRFLMITMTFRQGFGVLCGMLAMLHVFKHFWDFKMSPLVIFTTPYYLDYKLGLLWGLLAAVIAFMLLITSNRFSMILLKKNWRRLHWLTHPLLILIAIHIALIRQKDYLETLWPVGLIIILWIAAWWKKRRATQNTTSTPPNPPTTPPAN